MLSKFLENRARIFNKLPQDFDLSNYGSSDSKSFDIDVENDENKQMLYVQGSVDCVQTYWRDETREEPSESEESYTVEIYEANICDEDGDIIHELTEEEKTLVKNVIQNLY